MMKNGLIALMLLGSLNAWADTTLFPPLEMGAFSQEIPKGAKLNIKFVTPLNSETAFVGEPFVAVTATDLWSGNQLILPKGTTVRGRVESAHKSGFLDKGGLLRLTFDHVQMPSGDLRPLRLSIDAASAKQNAAKNGLYTDPGINAKLNNSVDKGLAQYNDFHQKGVAEGKAMGGGLNMLLTVPTTTIAGVATGTAVTTVAATKAVFGKGDSVDIKPGEQLILDFSQTVSLQAQ